jgi:O-antigen ligase
MNKPILSSQRLRYRASDANNTSTGTGIGKRPFPQSFYYFIVVIAVSLVNPFLTVPVIGISIYAPLFFLLAAESVFRPPISWSVIEKKHLFLPALIAIGVFISWVANGMAETGVPVTVSAFMPVIRLVYWVFLFALITYVVVVGRYELIVAKALGWGIFVLAVFRWAEVVFYDKIGAASRPVFFPQNAYGLHFSTFSAFLLFLAFAERGWKRGLAFMGYVLLWGAAAVNGSRGSWIGMAVGLMVFLFVVLISNPGKFAKLAASLLVVGAIFGTILLSLPQISYAIESRLDTFERLDNEKSYQFRQIMNQKAWLLFRESPLFGVGAGRFGFSSVEELELPFVYRSAHLSTFDNKSAHNGYLNFLAESGLAGFVPYVLLLFGLFVRGFMAAYKLCLQHQYWGIAIYSALIGMSVHLWVISSLTTTGTWFIYGLAAAMIVIAKHQQGK